MKESGYFLTFWTKWKQFFSAVFSDKVSTHFVIHSDEKGCLKPSNATLKRLLELKHRQIYKTQRLSH